MKTIQSNSTRLIINTAAQYGRTVINLILSLYSTRLILGALGLADYGIFTLIGGVVSMLAFLTTAMVSTTQRFMSYHQTKSDLKTQQKIFANSLILHFCVSLIILIALEVIGLFLFDGFLNIREDRIGAAKIVYQCAIAMILISFMSAPFKALLISRENIIYISIIEVADGVLKVGIATLLTIWGEDKLVLYAGMMVGVTIVNLVAFFLYDFRNYEECVLPRMREFDKGYIKSMSSFVGWQLYSTGCVIGRTQGTAIVLNKYFGTVINAAFGIALQLSGAISFVSNSLLTAINPQIVKTEGGGERVKMLKLAELASKFGFLLLALLVVPLLFSLKPVLHLWLGEVPQHSILFCSVILITSLIDQITMGLGLANQAIGNIGPYSLIINTIKILTIPCLIILLTCGVPLNEAIWCYAFFELLCALARIPFLKYTGGLKIMEYVRNVFFRIMIPFIFLLISYSLIYFLQIPFIGFVGCGIIISLIYGILIFKTSLDKSEQSIVNNIIVSLKRKLKII